MSPPPVHKREDEEETTTTRLFKMEQPPRRPRRAAMEIQPIRMAEKQNKKKLPEALDARQPFMNRGLRRPGWVLRTAASAVHRKNVNAPHPHGQA